MANYGYYRVSTSEKQAKQNYERQQSILANSGIVFEKIFEEHISGGVRADQRAEFNKLLSVLQDGDTVVVSETSRLGRNYIDNFEMLDIITIERKANIKFISNGMELEGGKKLNPYQWLTLSQFFIMDEFQKRQIGYNTANALQAKIAKGQKLGTPKRALTEEQITLLKADRLNGISWDNLQEKYNISRGTVARYLRQEE